MRYRVLIEQDEEGVFVAEVPSLPGCLSQGETRDEAPSNVSEAIALYLDSLEDHGAAVPPPITEEIIEVCGVGSASGPVRPILRHTGLTVDELLRLL